MNFVTIFFYLRMKTINFYLYEENYEIDFSSIKNNVKIISYEKIINNTIKNVTLIILKQLYKIF